MTEKGGPAVTELAPPVGGLYEHWYGTSDIDASVAYWAQLGFGVVGEGQFPAAESFQLYGVEAPLKSVRLSHQATDRQGLVRLQAFEGDMGEGLAMKPALSIGSRWSGFYTKDILAVQDAYRDEAVRTGEEWKVSELARLFITDSQPGFYEPFIGIRESSVTGLAHRHAFLQRVGFERPGFGTFAKDTPLPVTECTHGNVVVDDFSKHEFFSKGLGLEVQTPAHTIDWNVSAVRKSLELQEGESFDVIVYEAPGEPSGLLRVYGPNEAREDNRLKSRPGQLGNCGYSYRYPGRTLEPRILKLEEAGATDITPIMLNEFGEPSVSFVAPDGFFWNLLEST